MTRLLMAGLLTATPALSVAPPPPDTCSCQYWLDMLSDIERLENFRVLDVPKVREAEGYYAATDWDIELREQIIRIMAKIEKDCAR